MESEVNIVQSELLDKDFQSDIQELSFWEELDARQVELLAKIYDKLNF